MPRIDERARYTILVHGRVDEDIADWCGPITITSSVLESPAGARRRVTTLDGIDTDQAGLVGILRHLHGLGVIVLAVTRNAALL